MQTLDETKKISSFGTDTSLLTYDGHSMTRNPNGSASILNYPVFKAGTFRDSAGDQQTWTTDELARMVQNFAALKAQDIFPNVPVRSDHSGSVDKVIGYFDAVRVSPDGMFLLADFTVTEPGAINKIARGTYRSRSLEVGLYESNDGDMYYPVVFGVAFVDIPAVEGLHTKNAEVSYFSMTSTDIKETIMPDAIVNDRGAQKPDHEAAPTGVGTYSNGIVTMTVPSAPHAFRINGGDSTDTAAVQSHIDSLEAFAKDTREENRKAFVNSLVASKKIAAPQAEMLSELAVDMSDAQFAKFTASYAAAPSLSLLEAHGNGTTNLDGQLSQADSEIEILTASVQQHKRAGLTAEQIANTASFKKLAVLTAAKN